MRSKDNLQTDREEIKKNIGIALREIHAKGITWERIADRMEVSYNTIKNWDTGRRVPKLPAIRRLEGMFCMKIL